ncbi:hypothetical protein [Cryptosporangium sp. NPDC048952]|uniref:hypothetical protein n=1 Tax=Cryptosporangium sp. NPDC048952 TaxID=3363961 RepID=UPI00371D4EFC
MENRETTVLVEFVRSASGADDRARVTRGRPAPGRVAVVDAAELDVATAAGAPGGDLRWLVRLVPALLVAMAPGH